LPETKNITTLDEFEEEYRKGVGVTLPWRGAVREASADNIRRFGDGIGDMNPLYRSEEHAANSRFGMLTAPPTFVYGASIGIAAAINGNIHPARLSSANFPMNYAGADLTFHRPIWLGDKISSEEKIVDIVRKQSKRIGPFCICMAMVTYHNQRKELVATKKTLMARYENIGDKGISYDRKKRDAVVEEPPDPLVFERKRRGSETLYWEDVTEGDEVPHLRKGTYTVTELFLFTHGVVGTGRSPRAALEAEDSKDLGGGGRFDEEHARKRRNMPGQFDWGPQRICWLGQIVTDWMSDDGALLRLDAKVRHPNIVGDTNTLYGNVTRKYTENGSHLVELGVRNENQSGLTTALGTATVLLPSKDGRTA